MEASLKLKEISYIQCEGFAAGELKHGTIALIEEGTPVLALLSDPVLANHTRGNIQEVAARGAKVLTIAEENVAKDNRRYRSYDCTPFTLSPDFNGCTNSIGRLLCNTPPWT